MLSCIDTVFTGMLGGERPGIRHSQRAWFIGSVQICIRRYAARSFYAWKR